MTRDEALELLEPLAAQGDVRAQAAIGLLYARGEGTERDLAVAEYWLTRAAQQDQRWAEIRDRVVIARSGAVTERTDPASSSHQDRRTQRFLRNHTIETARQFQRNRRGVALVDYGARRRAVNRNTVDGR